MRRIIEGQVSLALEQLKSDGVLPEDIPANFKVERPREKGHGDFATNAALVLCRLARMKPRDLAEKLIAALPRGEAGAIERCEVAGPGFINFFVATARLQKLVPEILEAGTAYGRSDSGQGKRVQVEFVSANPTGPLHVGHGRGAVFGDVMARLLTAVGCSVEREYYINDAGNQIDVLGHSVLHRYREVQGLPSHPPKESYPGEYVTRIARELYDRDGDRWLAESEPFAAPSDLPLPKPPREVVDFAMEGVLADIRGDLEKMDIIFDSWFSERSLHENNGIEVALDQLKAKELIYEGVLERPKGLSEEESRDWQPRPQMLFRSTQFGDDVDRPLKKPDGGYTYFSADVAYHWHKAQRGFDQLVNVWGADHGGYVKRVEAALEALTGQKKRLDVKLVQLVNLTRGGKPVRMSKRAGTFVTLREVIDEVGADAVRFWFLIRSGGARLDFDLDLAVSRSNDNPVFYVQYAHARVCSVWRQLKEKGLDAGGGDLSRLTATAELDLIRLLGTWPEVVEGAAAAHEPHRIPYYLLELAGAFHVYYNGHRILDEDAGIRGARISLITAVRQVIANGLNLLGVTAPESM
ncbi:MAG: arginine--tRNA ligase [Magnetococcales bacterium]|nr:arginine--tRNA ligase [Magnetococcales bacterium]